MSDVQDVQGLRERIACVHEVTCQGTRWTVRTITGKIAKELTAGITGPAEAERIIPRCTKHNELAICNDLYGTNGIVGYATAYLNGYFPSERHIITLERALAGDMHLTLDAAGHIVTAEAKDRSVLA